MLKHLLAHPLTRDLDIDAPETTLLRSQIIRQKPFLEKIYLEWYAGLTAALPGPETGPALELGSGGGFLKEVTPNLVTSEIFYLPQIDLVLDGLALPFPNASLRGIVMTNVFHHIPRPRIFLQEASRCLVPGGILAMVEPWVTPWSKQIYQHMHHEPFDPAMPAWEFPASGPLSSANGALPWIIFQRDRQQFQQQFPELQIHSIAPWMPLRYLLSGGVSMRSLMPGWSFHLWRGLENCFQPWMQYLGMFARLIIQKSPSYGS